MKYTEEMKQFIREQVKGIGNAELAERVSEQFGVPITTGQISSYKGNNHLSSGLTGRFVKGQIPHNKGKKGIHTPGSEKGWFQKGNVPQNHRPVGSERVNGDGYIEIKVAEPNQWKTKQAIEWEKKYGAIPKGKVILFLDGNPLHTEMENLMLIDRKTHLRLNRLGLRYTDRESTRTGVTVAELHTKIAEKKTAVRRGKVEPCKQNS